MWGGGLPYFPFHLQPPDEKKAYYCQKCENHKERNLRRNHKTECKFKDCQCEPCRMVDDRSNLNAQIKSKLESDSEVERLVEAEEAAALERVQSNSTANIERKPCCQRCRAHGKKRPLRNHKRHCEFKSCDCEKCKMVDARRQLMAKQIKLRREQKRERERNQQREAEEQRKEQMKSLNAYAHAHPLPHFLFPNSHSPAHLCPTGPFPPFSSFPTSSGASVCPPNPHFSPATAFGFPFSPSALAQLQAAHALSFPGQPRYDLPPPPPHSQPSLFRIPFSVPPGPLDLSPPATSASTATVQLPSNVRVSKSTSPVSVEKASSSKSGSETPPPASPKPELLLPPKTPFINVTD